eukprot:TRINITY_DN428_c0_g6_i1.p1 TRINITY_DN428_c0_g6~~TRINITY_DN428_c0_g6_i1.p1  ORF type:complete len:602 (-),score=160.71 TRINITY_DN428_c0_g6_i1:148-1953(-)
MPMWALPLLGGSSRWLALLQLLAAWQHSSADEFLGGRSLVSVAEVEDPALLLRLAAEVEDAVGESLRDDAKERLGGFAELLRPMFDSLPRNAHGNLDHSTVRYALNRFFVQRHGFVIRGFQSEHFDNSSSASQLLQGRVPQLVQELFEKRVGLHGSSLQDAALLAALLEHLIEQDLAGKLQAILQFHGAEVDRVLAMDEGTYYIELFMMLTITGRSDLRAFEKEQLTLFVKHFETLYPPWPQTQQMLREVIEATAPGRSQLDFESMLRILSEASNLFYTRVHREQCKETSSLLVDLEDRRSGRVRLVDFYNKAIKDHQYQFTETVEYLRHNGMLDESDATMPRVIIANYISGQANCVARTMFHAVCCPDECETHLSRFEQQLGRPEATPEEILAAEAAEGAAVSDLLQKRLHTIAAHHGGTVPLHGRLFAQWLHFVRPTSCAYPHPPGATYTKTMEEWEEDTGLYAGATMEEMHDQLERLQGLETQGKSDVQAPLDAPWHEVSSAMWSMQLGPMVEQPPTEKEGYDWFALLSRCGGSILASLTKGLAIMFFALWALMFLVYGSEPAKGRHDVLWLVTVLRQHTQQWPWTAVRQREPARHFI